MQSATASARYHQLVLLWPRDRAMFAEYVELVTPIVAPYGGALDRQLACDTIHGPLPEKPEVVNLVHYSSREAFESFQRDERFRKIVHLRANSTGMASIEGVSIRANPRADDARGRLYLVELACFGPGGAEAYGAYEAEAEPILARYGYHLEQALRVDSAVGLPFKPDLVKLVFFETADGMARMHEDPAHSRLEEVLYPAAVAESIWITGRCVSP